MAENATAAEPTAETRISEAEISRLVALFYSRVRADAGLAPIFESAIDDWPHHLEKLAAFWSSLMLTTGRYKGSPMAAHMKHRDAITPEMFDRWLTLWNEATAEAVPAAAPALQEKAARVAQSLQHALYFRLPPRFAGLSDGGGAVPYRTTPVVDEASLPAALRAEHRTKAGVWGVVRVLDGQVQLTLTEPAGTIVLSPGAAGVVEPQQPHHVEPLGPMRMQVEFYTAPPTRSALAGANVENL